MRLPRASNWLCAALAAQFLLSGSACKREHKKERAATPTSEEPEMSEPPALTASAVVVDPRPRCPQPSADSLELIDDFEDGDNALPRLAGRSGNWYVATDGTRGGTVRPATGPANPERLRPPHCDSNFAIHFAGSGFTTWGAVLGATLRFDKTALPADLSGYTGIRFFARASESHTGVLRVSIDDASTHPNGGTCARTTAPGEECWNAFSIDLPSLSEDWEQHFIHFDKLAQNSPRSVPILPNLKQVYVISFKASPGNTFDLWLDDVGLFR